MARGRKRPEYSFRATALMAVVTLALAITTFDIPEYWGDDIITAFFVLTVISALRTVHVGAHSRS